ASIFQRVDGVAMKGIDEPVELWMWTPDVALVADRAPLGEAPPPERVVAAVAPPVAVPAPDVPSIVVLPFDNMSGDPVVDSLVDGIVEEITATLSRIRDFTV